MQVYKTLPDGSTVYAWNLIGVKNPDNTQSSYVDSEFRPQLVWLAEGSTPDRPDLYEIYNIEESTRGTKYGLLGSRWATCYVCQGDFQQSKMTLYKGHWYCREDSRDLV